VTEVAISVVAIVAGAASVGTALRILRSVLERPPHVRTNYRGRPVAGTAGVVLVVPLVLGAVIALVASRVGVRVVVSLLAAGLVMTALGYIDDVYGERHARGFGGHVRELLHGRVTTGLIKAAGGGVVGIAAAAGTGRRGVWILVAGSVVALSANLANLVDLRPARALKVWFPATTALVLAGLPGRAELVLLGVGGGAAVFAYSELRERVMLGDTGAGLLGVVVGVATISSAGPTSLLIILGTLVALTAASEVVSFSRVIEAVPPLRWVDGLGRRA